MQHKFAITIKKPSEKHTLSTDNSAEAVRFIRAHAIGTEVKVNAVVIAFGIIESINTIVKLSEAS